MSGIRTAVAVFIATAAVGGVLVSAQQQQAAPARGAAPTPGAQGGVGQTPSPLPLSQTIRDRGTSATGAYEGWFVGKDGERYALVGYFNRNNKEELDIPIGPNNRIEPGGPDQGQPTHFLTGRQWGVFAVKLPKDLGTKKLVWTLVANGFTNAITLQTYPTYIIEPFMNSTTKAVPPVLKFDPSGTGFAGPPTGTGPSYTATTTGPLTIATYTTPDTGRGRGGAGGGGGRGAARGAPAPGDANAAAAPDPAAAPTPVQAPAAAGQQPAPAAGGRGGRGGARGGAPGAPGANPAAAAQFGRGGATGVVWSKYRGPGVVKFTAVPRAAGAPADGKSETTVAFDTAGEYLLHAQLGNGNGEQCCWTSTQVKVTVK